MQRQRAVDGAEHLTPPATALGATAQHEGHIGSEFEADIEQLLFIQHLST